MELESRKCDRCDRKFKVLKKSRQEYCSNFCEKKEVVDIEGRHEFLFRDAQEKSVDADTIVLEE